MVEVEDIKPVEVEKFDLVRFLFLRAVALIYLIAFASLLVQIIGLVGHNGILPVDQFLPGVKAALESSGGGTNGGSPFLICPTLFWFAVNDSLLTASCIAGIIAALFVMSGVLMRPALLVLWLLYRSIVSVGGDFLSFQWDILLLETGFLCIFFADGAVFDAPWKPIGTAAKMKSASHIVLWLFRILLFKLMFLSGVVKLKSEDPTWWNLTALNYHYWTQPLPTPLAWYAAQFPDWFQKISTAIMFTIEIGVPFMIFAPRPVRRWAAAALLMLQLLIAATGNYTFFNLLTMFLCLTLLDDTLLARALPKRLVSAVRERCQQISTTFRSNKIIELSLAAVIGTMNCWCLVPALALVPPVTLIVETLQPLNLVNRYGLFASMTTTRHEIVIEGSADGEHWLAYEFPYKPGDLKRPPPWVAPYQPRLDWQMWFAALGTIDGNQWFKMLIVRMLEGSPDVLRLFEKNPFPQTPPKFIRASLYDYHFTDFAEMRKTGDWWKRSELGLYSDPVALRAR